MLSLLLLVNPMPTEYPNRMTPIDPDSAAKAMAAAYKYVVGSKPSRAILGLMMGQWALETGNGKSVHNYNFGNKKASGGDDYQFFRCSEVVNGVEVFYDPPHPTCKFAAYPNAEAGAVAHIQLLKKRPHWWKGLQSGTIKGFIDGLTTAPAYFTASRSLYERVLGERMANYADVTKKYAASPVLQVIVGSVVAVGALWGTAKYVPKKYLPPQFNHLDFIQKGKFRWPL